MVERPPDEIPVKPPTQSLSTQLLSGAIWMVAMRWSIRLISLLSLIVLARLLDKKDFGLVAVANSVAALPTVILELGVELAIIRERDPVEGIFNTAWTIRIMQMVVASFCVLISGNWVANFYGEPRIAGMFPLLALCILMQGFENTWIVALRKSLNFKYDFAYNAGVRFMTAITTVILAFALRSYWALIYGQVAGAAFRVLVSFAIARRMPRLSLSHWNALWSFSQWSILRSLAEYTVRNVDRLILGRVTDAGLIGAYTLGREIADIPISEISAPVNRALGPGFSRLQHDPKRLAEALVKTLGAVAVMAFPIGLGLAATSANLVPLMLGKGWEPAIPIVQILALSSLVAAVRGVMGNTLAVIGYMRLSAAVMWVRATLLIVIGIPAATVAGPIGMAGTFFISEVAACSLKAYYFRRHLPHFSFALLGTALIRPAISAIVMLCLVVSIDHIGLASPIARLICQVAVGAVSYTAVLLLLWQIFGRPDGLEWTVIQHLRSISRLYSFSKSA